MLFNPGGSGIDFVALSRLRKQTTTATGVWGEQQLYCLSRNQLLLSIAWERGIDSSLSLDRTRCYKCGASSEGCTISAIERENRGLKTVHGCPIVLFLSFDTRIFIHLLGLQGEWGLNVENLIRSPLDISSTPPPYFYLVFLCCRVTDLCIS